MNIFYFLLALFSIDLQVATHHEHLLSQAAGASHLSGSLTSVRDGLNDLESLLEKYTLFGCTIFQLLIHSGVQ